MTPHPGVTEHGEQQALFQWAEHMVTSGQYPELHLMFAIPNWRPKKGERLQMAAEGVKPGTPDIFIPVPRRGIPGMFIELKVGKNKPTELQRTKQKALQAQGYYVVTCWGFEQARDEILFYLEGRISS